MYHKLASLEKFTKNGGLDNFLLTPIGYVGVYAQRTRHF